MTLAWPEARNVVIREAQAHRPALETEVFPLGEARSRILAGDAAADRDYPPFNRATRDGFALHASDLPDALRIVGESRAGRPFDRQVRRGEAIEIMTGAAVPDGQAGEDLAVVMVEYCATSSDGKVTTDRPATPGQNIAHKGCEARRGEAILRTGDRVDHTGIAWLATTGRTHVEVFRRPRVAILATGDEIVPIRQTPLRHQIRNSNAHALAAQIQRAGGEPVMLPIARDDKEDTIRLIREGLNSDLLLLSGGVSAGKFDFVEPALAELGAEFCFDRVLIQPGQPLVFGRCASKLFFGLPGNPGSTMITFELFARAAVALLGGAAEPETPIALARMARAFSHKPGLTRFLPAHLRDGEVTPVSWQGSGDVPSYCRANAFLIAEADTPEYNPGDTIQVLMK